MYTSTIQVLDRRVYYYYYWAKTALKIAKTIKTWLRTFCCQRNMPDFCWTNLPFKNHFGTWIYPQSFDCLITQAKGFLLAKICLQIVFNTSCCRDPWLSNRCTPHDIESVSLQSNITLTPHPQTSHHTSSHFINDKYCSFKFISASHCSKQAKLQPLSGLSSLKSNTSEHQFHNPSIIRAQTIWFALKIIHNTNK